MQVAAMGSVIYMWSVGFLLRESIADIFKNLQIIHESSNLHFCNHFLPFEFLTIYIQHDRHFSTDEKMKSILIDTKHKSEWITILLVQKTAILGATNMIIMGGANILYCKYVYGYINVDMLYIPFYFV